MSRYLKYPSLPIVDLGARIPANLFYEELNYKRKKQDESDALMDDLAKVNFVNDPKDQAAADKVREEIRSTINEISPLYMKDPAAANKKLKEAKRNIERRTLNTGEDINTFTTAVATKEAQQKELDKLGVNKDAVDQWTFFNDPYEQWTGSAQDPTTGKWSTNMKFPSVTDIGDPYKTMNDRISQMPDRTNYGNPQFISVEDPTTGEMVTVLQQESITSKGLKEIKAAATDMIYTDPEVRRMVQAYSRYNLAHADDDKKQAVLQYYVDKRDQEINNLTKTISDPKSTPDIISAAEEKKSELENQLANVSEEQAMFEYQADNMVQTAKDLYGKPGYKVDWSNIHRVETEGSDPALYKDLGQIAGGANITVPDIKTVKRDLTDQAGKIDQYTQSIDNLAKSQAKYLGLENERMGVGTGLAGLPTVNDQATDALKGITPWVAHVLGMPISAEEQKALIEHTIESTRIATGSLTVDANNPFKFAPDNESGYSFDEFIKDHEILAQNQSQLQQAQIFKDRNDAAVQSLYNAAITEKDILAKSKLDYDSDPIVIGAIGVGPTTVTTKEPSTPVRQGILRDYFGVENAQDYNNLLKNLSSQSTPQEILRYQQSITNPKNDFQIAQQIELDASGNPNEEITQVIQGLSQRLEKLDSEIQKEVKKDPSLQKRMITNRILTPGTLGPTKDPIQMWSDNLVKSAWADTYRIGSLKTPTGEQLWEQLKREQKNTDIREATLIPSTFQARPVVNPTGPDPMIEISFSTKNTQVPPTTIVVNEDMDNAVYKSLYDLADNMAKSGNENAAGFIGHLTFGKDFFKQASGLIKPKSGETKPIPVGEFNGNLVSVSIDDAGKYQVYYNYNPAQGEMWHNPRYPVNDDPNSTAYIKSAIDETGKNLTPFTYHDRPNSIPGLFEFLGKEIIQTYQNADQQ